MSELIITKAALTYFVRRVSILYHSTS